jgi:hypothetical protein
MAGRQQSDLALYVELQTYNKNSQSGTYCSGHYNKGAQFSYVLESWMILLFEGVLKNDIRQ